MRFKPFTFQDQRERDLLAPILKESLMDMELKQAYLPPPTLFRYRLLIILQPKERILLNGKQLSDVKFDEYINYVYYKLYDPARPIPFFRFMTVAAFHIFVKEKVEVAVVEVGIGGRFDCTNLLPSPIACGVTSLALEHTDLLGKTLQDIAWHKCGIFKPVQ
jgi:folylpolyglutamate synthase/dihydrofolate synthase